ncbi:MAG: hypothetical protein HYY11_08710 [Candidatus Methylomirabilis oxyfera]|nr:hypothetical protein [Candidatus Methylomirabilis oxyfera]
MKRMALTSLVLVFAISIGFHTSANSQTAVNNTGIQILAASPTHLVAQVLGPVAKGDLMRIAYNDGVRNFVWQNVPIAKDHRVVLKDDQYLLPSQRLQCPSDEVNWRIFYDLSKGFEYAGGDGTRYRQAYGVPVQSFGGPGATTSFWRKPLKRDVGGNFWVSAAWAPSISKYNNSFDFQFSIELGGELFQEIQDYDTDGQGNLYVLSNIYSEDFSTVSQRISQYTNDGQLLQVWELPRGTRSGEFSFAAGLVIDQSAGYIYMSDDELHRVQRFTLDLAVAPFTFNSWGWIGLEDLSYIHEEFYTPDNYGRLDRPTQLALDATGNLYVNNHHFISKFSVATGEQLPFGSYPVLGWGGTFPLEESSHSSWAGRDGHWEWQWLAGIDRRGNIYVSDWSNAYVPFARIQKFDANGQFVAKWDYLSGIVDREGRPVYLTSAFNIAMDTPWGTDTTTLVALESGGRFYKSEDFQSGGDLYLGPGYEGCQFDLTRVTQTDFAVSKQTGFIYKTVTGALTTFSNVDFNGVPYTFNVEAETNTVIPDGMTSLWMPVRLGEPFRVTLFENGIEIPASDYILYVETQPGTFGTLYDYFRVVNHSGRTWTDVTFTATTQPEP